DQPQTPVQQMAEKAGDTAVAIAKASTPNVLETPLADVGEAAAEAISETKRLLFHISLTSEHKKAKKAQLAEIDKKERQLQDAIYKKHLDYFGRHPEWEKILQAARDQVRAELTAAREAYEKQKADAQKAGQTLPEKGLSVINPWGLMFFHDRFADRLGGAQRKNIEVRGRDLTSGWRGVVHIVTSQQTPQSNADAKEAAEHFGIDAEEMKKLAGKEVGTVELFHVLEFTPDIQGFAKWVAFKEDAEAAEDERAAHQVFFPWVPAWGPRYGLVFANPQPLAEPKDAKGALGLFDWNPVQQAAEGETAQAGAEAGTPDEWETFLADWTTRLNEADRKLKSTVRGSLKMVRYLAHQRGLEGAQARKIENDLLSLLQTAQSGVQERLTQLYREMGGRQGAGAQDRIAISITPEGKVQSFPVKASLDSAASPLTEKKTANRLAVVSGGEMVLAFTDQERVYVVSGDTLPLEKGEKVTFVTSLNMMGVGKKYVVLATKNGRVRRMAIDKIIPYAKSKQRIFSFKEEGDEILSLTSTDGDQELLLISRNGQALRFHEKDVPEHVTEATQGVRGIQLPDGDALVSMTATASPNQTALVLLEDGTAKRVKVDGFPFFDRNQIVYRTPRKWQEMVGDRIISRSRVAGVYLVDDSDQILSVTQGRLVRKNVADLSVMTSPFDAASPFVDVPAGEKVLMSAVIPRGEDTTGTSEQDLAQWQEKFQTAMREAQAAGREAANLWKERIERARKRSFPAEEHPTKVISVKQGPERWADQIAGGLKTIETREWKDTTIVGKTVYLHVPKQRGDRHGRIIGKFRVIDVVDLSNPDVFAALQSMHRVPYFEFGSRFGYVLGEIETLDEPMPYPGGQRFFEFDEKVAEEAAQEEEEAQEEAAARKEAGEGPLGGGPTSGKAPGGDDPLVATGMDYDLEAANEIRSALNTLDGLAKLKDGVKNGHILLESLGEYLDQALKQKAPADIASIEKALVEFAEATSEADPAKITAASQKIRELAAASEENWEFIEPLLSSWGIAPEAKEELLGDRPATIEEKMAEKVQEKIAPKQRKTPTKKSSKPALYESLEVLRPPVMQTYKPIRRLRLVDENGTATPLSFDGRSGDNLRLTLTVGGKKIAITSDEAEEVLLIAAGYMTPMKDNDPAQIDREHLPKVSSERNLMLGLPDVDPQTKQKRVPGLLDVLRKAGIDLPEDTPFYKNRATGEVSEVFADVARFVTHYRTVKKQLEKSPKADKTPNVRIVPAAEEGEEEDAEREPIEMYVSFNNAESLGRWGVYRAHSRPKFDGLLRPPVGLSGLSLNATATPEGWPKAQTESDPTKLQVVSWHHPVTGAKKGIRLGSQYATQQDIKKYLKADLLGANVQEILDGAWETDEAYQKYNAGYLDKKSYLKYVREVKDKIRPWAKRLGTDKDMRVIDLIRKKIAQMILSNNTADQQIGIVFYLMDTMHARIGGESTSATEAVGITKWRADQLEFLSDFVLHWRFIGKSGMLWDDTRQLTNPAVEDDYTIDPKKFELYYTDAVNKRVYEILKKRAEQGLQNLARSKKTAEQLVKEGNESDIEVFSINADNVNDFLKQFGPFTAKYTRPFLAGMYARHRLSLLEKSLESAKKADLKKVIEGDQDKNTGQFVERDAKGKITEDRRGVLPFVGEKLGHRRVNKKAGDRVEITGSTERVNYV
ncbi:MAG TPA: DNA gyrase C-terminal beta-propeller domain-containing protein, partial [Elusimicrobiota bacterium]|nr:DNA gyrase C-terminal beta-propeller domain-containing protein [Elusimicrobiota bacterium]